MCFPAFVPEKISSKEGSKCIQQILLVSYQEKEKKQQISVIDFDSLLRKIFIIKNQLIKFPFCLIPLKVIASIFYLEKKNGRLNFRRYHSLCVFREI